jgi:hypothetical protein
MNRRHSIRRALCFAGVALSLIAAAGRAQPLGTVLTELRIQSTAVRRFPVLNAESARIRIEQELARLAGEKFRFLSWTPAHLAADSTGPRLILELWSAEAAAAGAGSGIQPVCFPPAVRARLVPKPRGVEEETVGDREITGVCSSRLKNMTEDDFVAEVGAAAAEILGVVGDLELVQARMASQVPLARQLVADEVEQRLYLPRANLNALKESEIEVRFGDDANQFLVAHPFATAGDKTLVKVRIFDCSQLNSGADALGPFGACWHPSLPTILATCGEPVAYMKRYAPATRAEGTLSSAVSLCGTGATVPGIATTLTGDEP